MRRFADSAGKRWEAILGRESWGTFVVLFAPAEGGDVRKTVLSSESALAAEAELDALTDEELRARLVASSPW